MDRISEMKDIKRVVVKIGTSSITHGTGLLNLRMVEGLARQLSDLHNRGVEVVLVSSGAIGAGMGKLNLKERPKTIPEKQAAAAVGQGVLIHMYQKCFSEYGKIIGQILVTKDDISDRQRFLNARNTCFSMMAQGVIPIVNENDAVVTDEIKHGNKIGDNDTLSAMIVSLVDADLLIILSDIDGLYDSNPSDNPDAKLISIVETITDNIKQVAGGSGSVFGTGGMATKIKAAEIAVSTGSDMIIAKADIEHVLSKILDGDEVGTLFIRNKKSVQARKHWIGYGSRVCGFLHVDDGALKAVINNRKSLLPSGITDVFGEFKSGEAVSICNKEGHVFANGISNYNSEDVNRIKGLKTTEVAQVLGFKDYDEVIHANNMFVLNDVL